MSRGRTSWFRWVRHFSTVTNGFQHISKPMDKKNLKRESNASAVGLKQIYFPRLQSRQFKIASLQLAVIANV
ncbi:MAG: hypothetical protein CMJ47_13525 [Planctomyces sp.]|nr:hypothetical protein [Planctomyces sp.]